MQPAVNSEFGCVDPGLPKLAQLFWEPRKPYHTVPYSAKPRLSHQLLPVVTMLVPRLDLPTLVLLCWVGCRAIARCWGIFTGIGIGWVDLSSLAGVGPASLDLIHRESSLLGWDQWRWSLLGSPCPHSSCSCWPFIFGGNIRKMHFDPG